MKQSTQRTNSILIKLIKCNSNYAHWQIKYSKIKKNIKIMILIFERSLKYNIIIIKKTRLYFLFFQNFDCMRMSVCVVISYY